MEYNKSFEHIYEFFFLDFGLSLGNGVNLLQFRVNIFYIFENDLMFFVFVLN